MREVAEERARLCKRDRRCDYSQRVPASPGVERGRVLEARPGADLGQRAPFFVNREGDDEEGEGERGAFEKGGVEEVEE